MSTDYQLPDYAAICEKLRELGAISTIVTKTSPELAPFCIATFPTVDLIVTFSKYPNTDVEFQSTRESGKFRYTKQLQLIADAITTWKAPAVTQAVMLMDMLKEALRNIAPALDEDARYVIANRLLAMILANDLIITTKDFERP